METNYMNFSSSPCPPRSYKQSARVQARVHGIRSSPHQELEPQKCLGSMNFSMETFRSANVLKQFNQVEKQYQTVLNPEKTLLTPEEAIKTLRDVANCRKSAVFRANSAEEMLLNLETACFQPFVQENSGKQPRILYSQLLRGTEEILSKEQTACQQLRKHLQQMEERNNELPHLLQECKSAVTRAMESEILLEHKTKIRKRKDLRTWACNNLRTNLNDLLTRRSELKQQICAVASDLKKEQHSNKQRVQRLDDLRSASSLVDSKNSTPQQFARLTLVFAKNKVLEEIRRDRKTLLRTHTEAIFAVRIELRELKNQRVIMEKKVKNLEEEAANIKRTSTPRPDWKELQDVTVVTTAMDRMDLSAQMQIGATRNKLTGAKDLDEERASEQRLAQILASHWSTIAKVEAMGAELANIRAKDHAGDTILVEQKKLKHLHKEITRLMKLLETVKG